VRFGTLKLAPFRGITRFPAVSREPLFIFSLSSVYRTARLCWKEHGSTLREGAPAGAVPAGGKDVLRNRVFERWNEE